MNLKAEMKKILLVYPGYRLSLTGHVLHCKETLINTVEHDYIVYSEQTPNITINEPETKDQKVPHRCPVCGGNGMVSNGFYMTVTGHMSTTSTVPEQCKSCNGSGIVWG